MITVSISGMAVSLKPDLWFPMSGQHGHGSRNTQLNAQRSVFPSPTALMKALYLATFEASKKWTTTLRNWGRVYGELSIMYEGRLPE